MKKFKDGQKIWVYHSDHDPYTPNRAIRNNPIKYSSHKNYRNGKVRMIYGKDTAGFWRHFETNKWHFVN